MKRLKSSRHPRIHNYNFTCRPVPVRFFFLPFGPLTRPEYLRQYFTSQRQHKSSVLRGEIFKNKVALNIFFFFELGPVTDERRHDVTSRVKYRRDKSTMPLLTYDNAFLIASLREEEWLIRLG